MKDEFQNTKGFLKNITENIHYYVKDNVNGDWSLFVEILSKLLLLAAIIVVLDSLFKLIFWAVHSIFYRRFSKDPLLQALYKSKVLNSVANFLALAVGQEAVETIFARHPKSFIFLERTFAILMIIAGWILYKRVLASVEKYYELKNDSYRITAIRAITQSLEILGIFVFIFLIITNLFGINSSTIMGALTAMTAVIVLVFRDTILGFITGIHVSTSKNIKVGDWIGIPKYNIEGNILDISLLTTKIQNFDKTISTIPTYDLMSTEIRNHQIIDEGSLRRIKKSIIFNINSFKFLDQELYDELKKVNLISNYLQDLGNQINEERRNVANPEIIINGRQFTNIGVFRKYAQNYLRENPRIEKNETILVRQLDITPQGMPMEIYCFAKKEDLEDFENIQADIFDHLLSAAQEFDLMVTQIYKM